MDWVDSYVEATDGVPSPVIFRRWAAITAVSGALERRVYARTAKSLVFPGLFTMLVGPPASGKTQAIAPIARLWYGTKKLKVAPDSVTKAALIDSLEEADRRQIINGVLHEQHTLVAACPELGVLMAAHDLDFLSALNHIYDDPPVYRESRRSTGKKMEITNPHLVLLMGSQPGFLASLLPEEAWNMGFMSRQLLIYATEAPQVDLFSGEDLIDWRPLAERLQHITEMHGQIEWTSDAKAAIKEWHATKCEPIPEHSKLVYYNGRRIFHVIKLCMIAAAARAASTIVTLADFLHAREWLLDAERVMPDVFKDMVQRSDAQVLQELHFFLWQKWAAQPTAKRRPFSEAVLYEFLSHRVVSEKIPRVIEVAVRSNILDVVPGAGLYTPRPRHLHGVE